MDINNVVWVISVKLYLPHCWVLLPKPNDDDAVSLADTALGPGCERAVSLVQDNTMYILLLAQPTRQPVLVHAGGKEYIKVSLILSGQTNKVKTQEIQNKHKPTLQ